MKFSAKPRRLVERAKIFVFSQKNPKTGFLLFILFWFSATFLFIIYCAIKKQVTYDEAFTYLHYSSQSLVNSILNVPAVANNHILNSVLIKSFIFFLNPSQLVIRLPNILSYILFFIYSCKLSFLKKRSTMESLALLVAITSIPMLLYYFGLARGYGIGVAFLIIAVYYLTKYWYFGLSSYKWLAILAGGLMVYSSFTFLYLWASLVVVVLLIDIFKFEKRSIKELVHIVTPSLLVLTVIAVPLFRLVTSSSALFGERYSFIRALIDRTILAQLYPESILRGDITRILLLTLLLGGGAFLLYKIIKKQITLKKSRIMIYILLVLFTTIFVFAQRILIDSPFPTARTAIYYLPLLSILIVETLFLLNHKLKRVLLILLMIFMIGNGLAFAYDQVATIRVENEVLFEKEVISLKKQIDQNGDFNSGKIVITRHLRPIFLFYKKTNHIQKIEVVQVDLKNFKQVDYSQTLDYFYIKKLGENQALIELIKQEPVFKQFEVMENDQLYILKENLK